MGTGAVATAAGMAMLLYFLFTRRIAESKVGVAGEGIAAGLYSRSPSARKRRPGRRPAQPPSTWREAVATLAETLRFTYSETLGKWPIGDLAFGIKYLMRRQGNQHSASVYTGTNCVELKARDIMLELIQLRRLVDLCFLFSKKPFPMFIELAGFSNEDVILQEPKAGLLKPAFTILCDKSTQCILILIRGTHSIKDTLTAATGAVVPFHHSVLDEGGVSKLVLGYAHCGMVAAARWIAKCTTPHLLQATAKYPDYQVKIVGHSLGGGTAALLTYILREHKELSSSICVAFAPAACMTWELAESGNHFITSIINCTDLVPTFSAASVDDLRSEVMASSWLNDLRDQLQQTRFLNAVYQSASALGSRLASISIPRDRVAGAGALLRPVSSKTQVMMKGAQNAAQAFARNHSSKFAAWSCIGARRRVVSSQGTSGNEIKSESQASTLDLKTFVVEHRKTQISAHELRYEISESSGHDEIEEEPLPSTADQANESSLEEEEMTECEIWSEVEKELHRQDGSVGEAREEEDAAAKEIMEEESALLQSTEENDSQLVSSDIVEAHPFYPPGRIMHMVALPLLELDPDESLQSEEHTIGIYETPRELYCKIRLSKDMINDHYMPMYKKMMDQLIEKFSKEDDSCTDNSTVM